MAISRKELSWAAGLFEGEGTIRINKPTARNWGALIVSVVNTDWEVVNFFQSRWPGYLKTVKDVRPNHRQPWIWVTAANKAVGFLLVVRPYIRTRRVLTKLDYGVQFQDRKSGPGHVRALCAIDRQRYKDDQWAAYEFMKQLNRRGLP